MHHFVTEMCTHVHISITKWVVRCGLWEWCIMWVVKYIYSMLFRVFITKCSSYNQPYNRIQWGKFNLTSHTSNEINHENEKTTCMVICTHHNWPWQMQENLLISRVKTPAIAGDLVPLIKNLGAFVRTRSEGCVLYNDCIGNIKKLTYFNRPDFPFPSPSNNTLKAIDRTTWPCEVWLLPPWTRSLRRLWNSHVRSNMFKWRYAQRSVIGLSRAVTRWAMDANTCSNTGLHLFFEHHMGTDKLTRW